jgi:hypothetical protein
MRSSAMPSKFTYTTAFCVAFVSMSFHVKALPDALRRACPQQPTDEDHIALVHAGPWMPAAPAEHLAEQACLPATMPSRLKYTTVFCVTLISITFHVKALHDALRRAHQQPPRYNVKPCKCNKKERSSTRTQAQANNNLSQATPGKCTVQSVRVSPDSTCLMPARARKT